MKPILSVKGLGISFLQDGVHFEAVNNVSFEVNKGEPVALVGFGTFSVRHRAAREGRNPQTGAAMHIPASKVPGFKAGKGLKDTVKNS